jgi:hypothetical protein
VIGNHIDHHKDVPLVAGAHEIDKILFGSEVIIKFVEVSAPIAMIATVTIVDDGGDPYGIEAHTLDVIKVIDDSSVASAAVVAYIIYLVIPKLSQP